MLVDIYQYFGQDVGTSQSGDFATVSGSEWGKQRIYRRLMTNPGTYLQHPEYGAGLPEKIGRALTDNLFDEINASILSNIFLEERVAKTPPPVINIQRIFNGIAVGISYTDIPTNQLVILSFNVNI